MQNLDIEISYDISMASVGNTTEDDEICAVGEVQESQEGEVNLDNIEELLKKFKEQVEESSRQQKDKGKNIVI